MIEKDAEKKWRSHVIFSTFYRRKKFKSQIQIKIEREIILFHFFDIRNVNVCWP